MEEATAAAAKHREEAQVEAERMIGAAAIHEEETSAKAAALVEQARVDATFRACKPVVPVDLELAGLAITHDQYLVAGVRNRPGAVDGTSGLLVFDLAGGGPPAASVSG